MRRGFATMVGLLIGTMVLVLALSLYELVQRESHFHRAQEARTRAYLTARAGLELFKSEAELFTQTAQWNTPHTYELPDLYADVLPATEPLEPKQYTQIMQITCYHQSGSPLHPDGVECIGTVMPYRLDRVLASPVVVLAQVSLFVPEVSGTPLTWDFSQIEDESQ